MAAYAPDDATMPKDRQPLYQAGPVVLENGLAAGCAADEDDSISVYRGIPYAQPPVGALRWQPPQPPLAWEGVRDATAFGPACPQPPGGLISMFGIRDDAPVSEDCLHLNVWTPAQSRDDALPVMVWIHGGGFRVGSADNPMYNGVRMAARGIVLVSFNYRLNVLGGLAHPALSAQSGHNASGNYGLMDQIAALRWVRDNVRAFGGDPGNVTIFGESAGSRSVALLGAAPQARGLFHRGICQSGALRDVSYSLAEREETGLAIAARLGCDKASDPIAALRKKPWREIHDAVAFDSNPHIDGWVIPRDPVDLYADGDYAKVPLIIGINADEATIFDRPDAELFDTVEKYDAILSRNFGDRAAEIRSAFPARKDSDAYAAMMGLRTDQRMTLPARSLARCLNASGVPCYFYFFTRVPPWKAGEALGAHHGAEIAYHFGAGIRCGRFEADPELSDTDRTLTDALMGYWSNFARTGDPNGPNLPAWPSYDREHEPYQELGDTIRSAERLHGAALDGLEGLPVVQIRER